MSWYKTIMLVCELLKLAYEIYKNFKNREAIPDELAEAKRLSSSLEAARKSGTEQACQGAACAVVSAFGVTKEHVDIVERAKNN